MMRILGSILLVLIWLPTGTAEASCTGSGQSWSCTAGTTSAQVQTAVNSATDGATMTFASGSYSWNNLVQFSNSKGVTLICASAGACNVSVSGTILGIAGNVSGTNTKLYR